MSKFCFNCGKELDDSAMFCSGCGSKQIPPVNLSEEPTVMAPSEPTVIASSEPTVASPIEETVAAPIKPEPVSPPAPQVFEPVQNTPPVPPTPPVQQYYQPPVAPEPPKKNKTAVTVAVCAVILCVVLIATVAVLFITGTLSFNKDSKEDNEKGTTSSVAETTEDVTDRTYGFNIENNGSHTDPVTPTEAPTYNIIDNPIDSSIPYTKGEVRNGVYINEWAGFKFKVTPAYPEADAATYNSLNAQLPAGEYGYVAINQTTGTVLTISYEDNTSGAELEKIFQSSIDLTQSMLENVNPITFGSIEEINLCGEEYLYSTMYYTGTDIYGIMLMRMYDNKIISIVITGETLSQCYSFLNTFEIAYPSI